MNTVRTIVRTVLWGILGFLVLGFVLGHTASASGQRPERHPSISWCDSTKGKKDSVCWDWDKPNGFYIVLNHTDVYVPATGDYMEGVFTK